MRSTAPPWPRFSTPSPGRSRRRMPRARRPGNNGPFRPGRCCFSRRVGSRYAQPFDPPTIPLRRRWSMPWRLTVIDGADNGRYFPLGDTGSLVIGNSHKHSDVCLHDLLVARVHCQVDAEEGRVTVTALTEDKETLVNGQKIRVQPLLPGEVLRVGNSQLRLDEDKEAADDEVLEADEVVDPNDVVEAEVVDDGPIEVVEAEVVEAAPAPVPRLGWKELEQ